MVVGLQLVEVLGLDLEPGRVPGPVRRLGPGRRPVEGLGLDQQLELGLGPVLGPGLRPGEEWGFVLGLGLERLWGS